MGCRELNSQDGGRISRVYASPRQSQCLRAPGKKKERMYNVLRKETVIAMRISYSIKKNIANFFIYQRILTIFEHDIYIAKKLLNHFSNIQYHKEHKKICCYIRFPGCELGGLFSVASRFWSCGRRSLWPLA